MVSFVLAAAPASFVEEVQLRARNRKLVSVERRNLFI